MTHLPTRAPVATDVRTDADLLRDSLDDPELFEQIFLRHVRLIFTFVAARIGPEQAEDVTSDVFATAFQRRATFDPDATSARPWLYGIAANKLHQHRDSERRWLERSRLAPIEASAAEEYTSTDERMDAEVRGPALLAALAGLSSAERDVLLLHVLGDMSHAEIARALGIRRGTAKVRLSRGRAHLRDAMEHGSTSNEVNDDE